MTSVSSGQGAAGNNAAIFVDAQNHPSVGWGYGTSANLGEVVFATWDGSAWQTTTYPPITLPATAGANVDAIAVALDAMGYPVVAYRADLYTPTTTKTDVYVAAWTGSAWDTSFGAVGDPTSKTFDLVLDNQGAPIVSAANSDNSSGTYTWNGTSWAFTAGAGATNASVGLDRSGNPVMLNSVTTSLGSGPPDERDLVAPRLVRGSVEHHRDQSKPRQHQRWASCGRLVRTIRVAARHRSRAVVRLCLGQSSRLRQRRGLPKLLPSGADRRCAKRHLAWLE